MKKKKYCNNGITLVELIVVLVVAGLAVPTLLVLWATVAWQSVRSEATVDALFYATELLEQIKATRFDENATPPFSSILGRETTESIENASTYDDIDDFVGTTDIRILTPANGYSRTVNVEYVNLSSTGNWTGCGQLNCVSTITNCTLCSSCCYKRITVSARRNIPFADNVTLTTIVAGYRQ
ncbi:MAG: hypothetical protein N2606_00940 [Candidatus Omnitrophica bacterium]|nr:hypothetical protein [Candidatus Omnitrophota bacterium]